MHDSLRRFLTQWLMTVLFAAGLALPLLSAAGLISCWITALMIIIPLSGALSLASLGGRMKLFAPVTLLAAAGVCALFGFAQQVVEVMRGIVLQFSGTTEVLALIAGKATAVITVFITLLAALAGRRDAGGIPGTGLTVLVLLALWLLGRTDAMLLTVPALGASLTQLSAARSEKQPVLPILPWMLIISLACCAGVRAGVTVEPLRQIADDLRERITDYFFFTEQRSVFSLANEGYYPQGVNQLGGPATPYEHTVMAVHTSSRTYLRCVAKDAYTGHTWQVTRGSSRYLWIDPLRLSRRNEVFGSELPLSGVSAATQEVTVTMLSGSTSTLPVPHRLRELTVTADLVPYFNDAGEVFITRDLQAGDSYTVSASMQTAEDAGAASAAAACASVTDPAYASIVNTYTALPSHLQQELYDLTAQITANAETDYDRAMNILYWLRSNCTYTLDAAEVPANMDFVTSFLLGDRRGYCTYFASAMTVMCRMAGIPARYVEGYLAEPVNGTAIITGADGHAWTEVYLSGYGWMVFDATPYRSGSKDTGAGLTDDPQPTEQANTPEPTPAPTEEPPPSGEPDETPEPDEPEDTPEPDEQPDDDIPEGDEEPDDPPREDMPEGQKRGSAAWLWLLLIAAAVAGGVVRALAVDPGRMAKRVQDEPAAYAVWRQYLTDMLHLMKQRRGTDESPMAWMARLHDEGLPSQLEEAGAAEMLTAYSRHQPDSDSVQAMRRAALTLRLRLTRVQRVRLVLRRMVLPARWR